MRMFDRAEHRNEERREIEENELESAEQKRIPDILDILRLDHIEEGRDGQDQDLSVYMLKTWLNRGMIKPRDLEDPEVVQASMDKLSRLFALFAETDNPDFRWKYRYAIDDMIKMFKISPKTFQTEKMRPMLKGAVVTILKRENITWDDDGRTIDETVEKLERISPIVNMTDVFEDPETMAILRTKMLKLLKNNGSYLEYDRDHDEEYEYDSDVKRAAELKDFFSLPAEFFRNDPEMTDAVKDIIRKEVEQGYYNSHIYDEHFGIGKERFTPEELVKHAKKGLVSILTHDNTHFSKEGEYYRDESLENIKDLLKQLDIGFEQVVDEKIRIAAVNKVKELIEADIRSFYIHAYNQENSSFREAAKIMSEFGIKPEEINKDPVLRESVKKSMISTLTGGVFSRYYSEIYEEANTVLCFNKDFYDDPGLKQAAKDFFKTILSIKCVREDEGNGRDEDETVYFAGLVKDNLMLEDDFYQDGEIQSLAKEKITELVRSAKRYNDWDGEFYDSDFNRASEIKEHFRVENNFIKKDVLDELLSDQNNNTYVDGINDYFDKELVDKAAALKLKLSEAYVGGYSPEVHEDYSGEERYKTYFTTLEISHRDWEDVQNVSGPFKEGAEYFGYEKMFNYIYRPGLSRHDALHNFRRILTVANYSGLSPERFYQNILMQVAKDDSTYEEGTAHHKLNSLAGNINIEFDAIIEVAKRYSSIPKMQELLSELDGPEKIFSSWKMLKKYEEINKLLKQKEILIKLQGLRDEGKEKLSRYIETLAFHPNISMDKVIEFWQNPEVFLDAYDSHTPSEVQNSKKPSNYFHIPNLDLTAEELRDALVEGGLDKLQAIRPMEMSYLFDAKSNGFAADSIAGRLSIAFGKKREGIRGAAANPGKLYQKVSALFKEKKIKLNRALGEDDEPGFLDLEDKSDEEVLKFLSTHMDPGEIEAFLEQIREVLADAKIGLNEDNLETFKAKINKKSDPDGVVAGNDTACCMPFGSGKNNVYTFNPICALFTLQKKMKSGEMRTVTQSVLTKNKDIKKNIASVVEILRSRKSKMQDVVDEEVLIEAPSVLTCDNVETAPNFKGDPHSEKIIKSVYRDFFIKYMDKYAVEDGFDPNTLIIGKGFSDNLKTLPSVANNFIPEAPVGYSDNLGSTAYILDLIDDGAKHSPAFESAEPKSKASKGVRPLTFRDTLAVSYIEGKAYSDNQDLVEYLHNMENALIAKDINNTVKNRPNMSFKYNGSDGKVHGYMLAYEGRKDKRGERVLYITDLASDGSSLAGGTLLRSFAKAYKNNYLDKGDRIPLLAQLREKTSYKLITKNLDKLSEICGEEFEMREIGNYKVGEDKMHEVMIMPK